MRRRKPQNAVSARAGSIVNAFRSCERLLDFSADDAMFRCRSCAREGNNNMITYPGWSFILWTGVAGEDGEVFLQSQL